MEFLYVIGAMIILYVAIRLISWPVKVLVKLIINGVLGVVLLFLANMIIANFGITIGINPITALIAGFLGVPGVIILILFKMFM